MEVDDDTSSFSCLEFARVAVRSDLGPPIVSCKNIKINGEVHRKRIVEELGNPLEEACWCVRGGKDVVSSQSISSRDQEGDGLCNLEVEEGGWVGDEQCSDDGRSLVGEVPKTRQIALIDAAHIQTFGDNCDRLTKGGNT